MVNNVQDALKRNILYLILGPIIKTIEVVFDLLIPLIMKTIIDLSFNQHSDLLTDFIGNIIKSLPRINQSDILNYCILGGLIILIFGIIGFSTTMVTQYLAAKCASNVGNQLRISLFNKILKLNKKEINDFTSNKLHTIVNSDTYQVQQGVLFFIRLVTRAPLIIIGSLIISFILDYKVGLLFLLLIPAIIFIIFFFMRKSSKQYLVIQEQLETISKKTYDSIDGNKVIKVFNKEEYEYNKFALEADKYVKECGIASRYNAFINPLTFAIVAIIIVFTIILGSNQMEKHEILNEGYLLPSTLITLIAYLDQIFQTVIVLTNLIIIFVKSGASIKRVNMILNFKPSIIISSTLTKNINKDDEILSFDNVSFKYYDNTTPIINNVSFSLKKGESLGIVGGTGSGKSTIVNLISRFIDPSSGNIKYKGIDIKDYSLIALRDEIGVAFQKAILFNGSIKSNMLIANNKASDNDIKKVLDVALASEFINKYDDNINHEVKEKGANFSGGQKQRLNIARTLIKNPELLILDDSTSALDLLSDKKVRENISNNYKDITKIIISQRISTVINCNNILVLDKGKIVGFDNHNNLLKNCLIYKEIYDSQNKKENI